MLLGCNLCQSFIGFVRTPPVDDYVVRLLSQGGERACLAEYDEISCKNAVEMEYERMKQSLFTSVFTEERFCGYLFPVCG